MLFFLAHYSSGKGSQEHGPRAERLSPVVNQPTGNRKSFGRPETRHQFLKQFTVTSAALTLGPQLIGGSSASAAEKTAPVTAENAVDVA